MTEKPKTRARKSKKPPGFMVITITRRVRVSSIVGKRTRVTHAIMEAQERIRELNGQIENLTKRQRELDDLLAQVVQPIPTQEAQAIGHK